MIQTYTLYIQESPREPLLMTDVSVRIDTLRTGHHWLFRLIARGILKNGNGYQLRTRTQGFRFGRVVSSGILMGRND